MIQAAIKAAAFMPRKSLHEPLVAAVQRYCHARWSINNSTTVGGPQNAHNTSHQPNACPFVLTFAKYASTVRTMLTMKATQTEKGVSHKTLTQVAFLCGSPFSRCRAWMAQNTKPPKTNIQAKPKYGILRASAAVQAEEIAIAIAGGVSKRIVANPIVRLATCDRLSGCSACGGSYGFGCTPRFYRAVCEKGPARSSSGGARMKECVIKLGPGDRRRWKIRSWMRIPMRHRRSPAAARNAT
jgi:hypothetical protein